MMKDIVKNITELNRQIASFENGTLTTVKNTIIEYERPYEVDIHFYNRTQVESKCFAPTSLPTIWSTYVRVFLIVLYCITFLAALWGNIMVIMVQRTARFIPLSPYENIRKYLLNLAVSDIVIGVACAPFTYVHILLGRWIFLNWLCPVTQFVQLVCVCVTTITLMVISLERYLALVCPVSNVYQILKSNSTALVATIWTIAFAYACILMRSVQWNNQTSSLNITGNAYYQCESFAGISGTDRKLLITKNFVLTFAVPLIVLTFTYNAIRKKLVLNNVDNNQNVGGGTNLSKIIKTLWTIIVLHGVCWTPIKVYQVVHEYSLIEYCTEQQYFTQLYLHTTFHWLAMVNCVTNPVVYTFSSQRFRNGIKKLLKPSN